MRAPLHAAGQQWHVSVERGRLVYQDERGLMDLAAPKLFGRHQFDNAGLAIATLARDRCVQDRDVRVRGRHRQRRMAGADAAAVPRARWSIRDRKACEIWLDGGHNAEGGRVAAAALGDLEERVSRPLVVIAGMMANKDAGAFLANFAGLTRHIIAVQIPGRDNAMPPDRLADAARALGMRVENAASVEAALHALVTPCLRSAAADSDYRLALPRRPCAGRQRHAACIGTQKKCRWNCFQRRSGK